MMQKFFFLKTSFFPHSFELQFDLLLLNLFFGETSTTIRTAASRRKMSARGLICIQEYFSSPACRSRSNVAMERKDAESAQSVFPLLNHAHAKRGRHSVNANRAREWAEGGLFSPFCVCARESSLIRLPPPSLDIHRETEANTDTCAKRVGGRERRKSRSRIKDAIVGISPRLLLFAFMMAAWGPLT